VGSFSFQTREETGAVVRQIRTPRGRLDPSNRLPIGLKITDACIEVTPFAFFV